VVSAATLQAWFAAEIVPYIWPFFRVLGVVMVAPVFGARLIPVRARIALGVALTAAIAPAIGDVSLFASPVANGFLIGHEIVVGVAMGFILQMIFDALVIGGQTIAMSMGLGFAMMVDPQRGVSVPVLSQFFVIFGMLIFLSLGGHLALIRVLADSFVTLPVGQLVDMERLGGVAAWGSQMFIGAVRIALPAVSALLIANLAFGVMSRAAPTLNLFAVGFPVALLLGFIVLLINIGAVGRLIESLLADALERIAALAGA
jgi:flagellar biosynthetic protein FliR